LIFYGFLLKIITVMEDDPSVGTRQFVDAEAEFRQKVREERYGASKTQPGNRQPAKLTAEEQQLVNEINAARNQPNFYITILEQRKSYYKGKELTLPSSDIVLETNEGVAPVHEAITYLKSHSPSEPLYPVQGLSVAADESLHHFGAQGKEEGDSLDRIKKFGLIQGGASSELLHLGDVSPREIVTRMLIDDGLPDRSQRNTLLDPKWKYIGLSIGNHNSDHKRMAVIVVSERYVDK